MESQLIIKKLKSVKLLFLLIFVIVSHHSIKAQSLLIGKIQDGETSENINYAYVTINDSLHFITNDEGVFISKNIINDLLNIQVNMLGYEQYNGQATSPFSDTLVIKLKPTPFQLEEILVEEKKQKPFKAKEIVEIAIDSLYTKRNRSHTETYYLEGLYNQIHYSFPRTGFSKIGKYNLNPKLDTMRRNEYLIQAYISKSKENVSIDQLRRSNDYRKYYHSYSEGEGKAFRLKYVANDDEGEKAKAIKREKDLYDLGGFFQIDPIGNFYNEVKENRKLYLSQGTYSYLNHDFTKHHSFKIDGVIDYAGSKVVKIKILPSSSSYTHGVFSKHHWIPVGYLYVRMKDFGILRMEYSYILNPKTSNFAAMASVVTIGLPILFKDVILYKEINGELRLAYLSRFQKDIDVNRDNDDNPEEDRYYYLEREFSATRFAPPIRTIANDATLESIYDTYEYSDGFWEAANIKTMNTKAYKKIVSDLEKRSNTSLKQQFINNSNN